MNDSDISVIAAGDTVQSEESKQVRARIEEAFRQAREAVQSEVQDERRGELFTFEMMNLRLV